MNLSSPNFVTDHEKSNIRILKFKLRFKLNFFPVCVFPETQSKRHSLRFHFEGQMFNLLWRIKESLNKQKKH